MIRYPSITGRTPEEQIEQLKRELFKMVDQMNYELNDIRRKENSNGGHNTDERR